MNAILPEKYQFYDPNVDLPDYDFFSPDVETDTREIVDDLTKAGFTDVYSRIGIHEGTKKILVNFRPIADITALDPELNGIFMKRAVVKEGLYYTDPDILRMMMYLELSRPKGMIERWNKVLERLQLINSVFPLGLVGARSNKTQKVSVRGLSSPHVPLVLRQLLVEYCVQSGRILLSGPIEKIYERGIRGKKMTYEVKHVGGPVIFFTPALMDDAKMLKVLLSNADATVNASDITLYLHKQRGDIVNTRIEIRLGKMPVALIVAESACHAYNTVPFRKGRTALIASPETMITEYLAQAIFTKSDANLYEIPPMVRAKKCLALAEKNYRAEHSVFPAFASICKGYQKGFPTLLKEKLARTKKEKELASLTQRKRSHTASKKKRSSTLKVVGK